MYGFSLSSLIVVAVISFMLGGGAVYLGTTVNSEPAPEPQETEEDFVFTRREEPPKEEETATTTEIVAEKEEEIVIKEEPKPKPKPAPAPVATPKPKPPTPVPPQPATVLNTITPSVAPTTITLPNGAVAELDNKGNIVRYISGGPEGGVTTQPQAQTQTTEQGSNTPSVNDFTPQAGNRIVKFPNGSIAEVRPDGSLVKLHYNP